MTYDTVLYFLWLMTQPPDNILLSFNKVLFNSTFSC